MKKKLLFTAIGLVLTTYLIAQSAIGDWEVHPAYHNATHCVAMGEKIYVLSDGSLYAYNTADQDVETYNKENLLSDNNISFIAYCEAEKTIVIIYSNANIDLLNNNEEVYNITDFKNKSLSDKTINSIKIKDEFAYIATNFGVVVLNIKKKEITNTYTLNEVVRSCFKYNDYIVATTSNGVFQGNVNDNLLDKNNWTKISKYVFHDLADFDNRLIVLGKYDGIYSLDTETQKLSTLLSGQYNYLNCVNNTMMAGNANELVIFNNTTYYKKYALDGNSNSILFHNNCFWSCEGSLGLIGYELQNESFTKTVSSIIPNSPRRNFFDRFSFVDENRLLVAGGCLNYFDLTFNEGTIMKYEEGEWTSFEDDSIATITGEAYVNITSVVQDPNDSEHHFASSFGHGVYEFRDQKFVKQYTYTNSIIETAVPDPAYSSRYVRVSRLLYDNNDNLWMTNTGVKNVLKILKNDGTWTSLYYSELENLPTVVDMMFDSRGWLWVTSMRANPGLFCVNMNNTLENTADDDSKMIMTTFTNQDGVKITLNYLYCITEDLDGNIWLGTDQGVFTMFNPSNYFNNDFYFTQIKIPRNDGSNYADYLLDGVYVNTICVDGANRKWIGTYGNGVYLISADGQETIHHFTTENSPLISNNINYIEKHPKTGKIYIGTDMGLVSYMSDATVAKEELNESNVYAYPNPVRPEYSGLITVTGLTFDSNIKITNSAGKLVTEGTSVGGQFTWNGTNADGKRVASGVYFVLATDSEGKEGVATKILFIR